MTYSAISNALGNQWLNRFNSGNWWLSLHTADPTEAGLTTEELAGGGYLRQPILFSTPSAKTITSTLLALFDALPASPPVTHLAVWDSAFGGTMQFRIALGTPITVITDGEIKVPVGDLALTI